MVRLTKIYTKFGDKGQTMLGDGTTTPKHELRVESYGTVDEANAAIGVAVARFVAATAEAGRRGVASDAAGCRVLADVLDELGRVQNDLFDVGADLCVPIEPGEEAGKKLRVIPAQTARLERAIDRLNEPMQPLSSFILPGGTQFSADLHLARTITRRAERCVSRLLHAEPQRTNAETMVYLNRLSDLLFVMGRVANDQGRGDVLWTPGKNR